MKTVLITGATGLIGQEIVNICLQEKMTVHYLTTSKHKINNTAQYKGFYWNPETKDIDVSCFEGVSAIINLVGASISKRWTARYKHEILTSRTQTTQLLLDTITTHNIPITQIISASAIGIYPNSLTNYYNEAQQLVSASFLGEVVSQWEAAVDQFSGLGIAVAKIRIGLVLSKDGGALPEIVKPIRFGAGAAFGTGEQWQSWIHVQDLARMFVFALTHNLEGVYNGVAPNPVSNTELTKAVAECLDKPLVLPNIPKFAMKIALGEMSMLLFESQRVSASKITDAAFDFEFQNIRAAINAIYKTSDV
jgi:hypothetical protein